MVLKCPGAAYKPLSNTQGEPAMTGHDIGCVHTMVGYLISTDAYFRDGGYSGTESQFGVGGVWGSDEGKGVDGVIWQWQDCMFQADANLDGNPRVISIETADNAPSRAADIVQWTPKQADAIVYLLDWWCRTDTHKNCPSSWLCHQQGIPRVLIPDTKPGRRGLAYHAQGVPGVELVPGGVKWSNAEGKECPGPVRIKQFKEEIVPRVAALGQSGGDDVGTVNEFDSHAQDQMILVMTKALQEELTTPGRPSRKAIDDIIEDNFVTPGTRTRIGIEEIVNKCLAEQLAEHLGSITEALAKLTSPE